MLETIGASSVAELFEQIPAELRMRAPQAVPGVNPRHSLRAPMSEIELRRHFAELAAANATYPGFLGAGVYDHYIPSTVPAILARSEFYTSYTPYQAEISQGTLQSIFEFQTLICDLTGMEVANASLYDGATALAEAALMASSITGRAQWVVSECVNPAYRETLRTYAWASGHTLVEAGLPSLQVSIPGGMEAGRDGIKTDFAELGERVGGNTACVIVGSPNFFGAIESMAEAEKLARADGALFVVSFDPISLGLLKPPGEYGADIAVGEGQSLGIPMAFGGPLLGLFACKREYMRQMPGRVVGATTPLFPPLVRGDEGGRPSTSSGCGYVLTLQTREQHVRRETATSNICTNQGLCALAATLYLSTLGKHGLRQVAELCLQKSHYLAQEIGKLPGYEIRKARFVKEFVVKCPSPVREINERLRERGIIGGLDLGRFYPDLADHMLLCVTEKRTREEMDVFVEALAGH